MDIQLHYWACADAHFADDKHAAITLDGLRCAGDEIQMPAYYSVRHDKACWMAPQVALGTQRRSQTMLPNPALPPPPGRAHIRIQNRF